MGLFEVEANAFCFGTSFSVLLVVLDQRPLSVEDFYWSWKCSSRGEYILSSEEECHS